MHSRNNDLFRRLAILSLAAFVAPGWPARARDLWLRPFSDASPWNTAISLSALYSSENDPRTRDLVAGHALIHAGQWGMPLYLAAPDDPWVRVRDEENDRVFVIRVPEAARPDPMGDGHMFVVDPSRHVVLEMYRARRQEGGIVARRTARVDLAGPGFFLRDGRFPGVRAMDASGFGGVLRAWELRRGAIDHALTFLLPMSRLRHGPVWPSGREDYWGLRDYHGHVPIGTLAAIPVSVRVEALGLSPPGLAVARALQRYGAYCDDSVGTDGLVLTAEGAAEGMPELQAARRDLQTIHEHLRAVINNHPW